MTLDGWTRRDRGPAATRIGGRVFFRESEIERFLSERTSQRSQTMAQLADLIEDELAERMDRVTPKIPKSAISEALTATANLAASVKIFDARLRERDFSEQDARRFVSAADSLTNCLHKLGGTETMERTLAEDIAVGAFATTGQLFPELLPDDMR